MRILFFLSFLGIKFFFYAFGTSGQGLKKYILLLCLTES